MSQWRCHGDCPALAQTFERICGSQGGRAWQAYFALVTYIGMRGRRRLKVHVPGCSCVRVDELAIIGVVAAAQEAAGVEGDGLARLRLQFLADSGSLEPFMQAAQEVAQAFAANDHIQPLWREPAVRRCAEASGLRRIH